MQFVIHVNTIITNKDDQILLVREKKQAAFNKLNLPGGHLELGEELIKGAKREVWEEVGVEVEILGLIGIYTGRGNDHYINFVFCGKISKGEPVANKNEVNGADWYSMAEILSMPDEKILNPNKLRKVISAHESGRLMPLDSIEEEIYHWLAS